jgi:CBS domain
VPADRQDSVRLREVATPLEHVVTTAPEEPLTTLMERMSGWPRVPSAVHTAGHALVLAADGSPIGVLTPADIVRASQLGTLRRRTVPSPRLWAPPWPSRSGPGPPPSVRWS